MEKEISKIRLQIQNKQIKALLSDEKCCFEIVEEFMDGLAMEKNSDFFGELRNALLDILCYKKSIISVICSKFENIVKTPEKFSFLVSILEIYFKNVKNEDILDCLITLLKNIQNNLIQEIKSERVTTEKIIINDIFSKSLIFNFVDSSDYDTIISYLGPLNNVNFYSAVFSNPKNITKIDKIPKMFSTDHFFVNSLPSATKIELIKSLSEEELSKLLTDDFFANIKSDEIALTLLPMINSKLFSDENMFNLFMSIKPEHVTKEVCEFFMDKNFCIASQYADKYDTNVYPLFFLIKLNNPCDYIAPELVSDIIRNSDVLEVSRCLSHNIRSEALATEDFWIKLVPVLHKINVETEDVANIFINNVIDKVVVLKKLYKVSGDDNENISTLVGSIMTITDEIVFTEDDFVEIICSCTESPDFSFWTPFCNQRALYYLNDKKEYKSKLPYFSIAPTVLLALMDETRDNLPKFYLKPLQQKSIEDLIEYLEFNSSYNNVYKKDEPSLTIIISVLNYMSVTNAGANPIKVYGVTNENSYAILALLFSLFRIRDITPNRKMFLFKGFDRQPFSVIRDKHYKLTDFDMHCINIILKLILKYFNSCSELVADLINNVIKKRGGNWTEDMEETVINCINVFTLSFVNHPCISFISEFVFDNFNKGKITLKAFKLLYKGHIDFSKEKLEKFAIDVFSKHSNEMQNNVYLEFIQFLRSHILLDDSMTFENRFMLLNFANEDELEKLGPNSCMDILRSIKGRELTDELKEKLLYALHIFFKHMAQFASLLEFETQKYSVVPSHDDIGFFISKFPQNMYFETFNSFYLLYTQIENSESFYIRVHPRKFPEATIIEKSIAKSVLLEAHDNADITMTYILAIIAKNYSQVFMELDEMSDIEVGNMMMDIYETNKSAKNYAEICLTAMCSCPKFVDDFIIPLIYNIADVSSDRLMIILNIIDRMLQNINYIEVIESVLTKCGLFKFATQILNKYKNNNQIISKLGDIFAEFNPEKVNEEAIDEIMKMKNPAQERLCGHYAEDMALYADDCYNEEYLSFINGEGCDDEEITFEIIMQLLEFNEKVDYKLYSPNDFVQQLSSEQKSTYNRILVHKPLWVDSKRFFTKEQVEFIKEMKNEILTRPYEEVPNYISPQQSKEFLTALIQNPNVQRHKFFELYKYKQYNSLIMDAVSIFKEKYESNEITFEELIKGLGEIKSVHRFNESLLTSLSNELLSTLLQEKYIMSTDIQRNATLVLSDLFKYQNPQFLTYVQVQLTNRNNYISQMYATIVSNNPSLVTEDYLNLLSMKIKNIHNNNFDYFNIYIKEILPLIDKLIRKDYEFYINYLDEAISHGILENITIITHLCSYFSTNNFESDVTEYKENYLIPEEVFSQNRSFWSVIDKHKVDFIDYIDQYPKELDTLPFLYKIPRILSYNLKVRILNENTPCDFEEDNKIVIHRNNILIDSMSSLMIDYEYITFYHLVIEFFNEKGLDQGGLTKEWFTEVSKALVAEKVLIFAPNERTLYPNPTATIGEYSNHETFVFVGLFIGLAIFYNENINLHLSINVLKAIIGMSVTLKDLESYDEGLYKSMDWILNNDVSDCDFSFVDNYTESGVVKTVELKQGGENIAVTNENKKEFVDLIVKNKLSTIIKEQMDAIIEGLKCIIDRQLISMFSPYELDLLICGAPNINVNDMVKNFVIIKPYTKSTPVVKFFFSIIKKWSNKELRTLLIFFTGSPQIPNGGFSSLTGDKKIKIGPGGDDTRLPVGHTCFNFLALPEYTTEEELNQKLRFAIRECNTFEIK